MFKSIKRKIILVVLLIITIVLYKSDLIMIQIPAKIQELTQNKVKLRDASFGIMKFVDQINPFVGKIPLDSITENITTFNIILPNNNLKLLEKNKALVKKVHSSYLANDKSLFDNNYIKSRVQIDGKTYKAKLKFHAGSDLNKKSQYRIKFKKSKLYDGMRSISLLTLSKSNASAALSYELQEEYLNLKVVNKLVKVKINGLEQGVYMLEERLSKELLEKNNLSGVDIIKFDNTWDHQYSQNHSHPFVYTQANMKFNNISKKDMGQKYILNSLLNKKIKNIYKLIDKDYWAKYMAILALYADNHSINGDNIKFMYNTSNGRVYPFLRTEHVIYNLETSNNYSFDKILYNIKSDKNKRFYSGLFADLIQDNEFRALRNKYLHELVSEDKNILNRYDVINEKIQKITDTDSSNYFPSRFYKFDSNRKRALLKGNLDTIKKYLKYNKVYVNFNRYDDKSYILEISADSNSPLKITNVSLDINSTKAIYVKDMSSNIISEINPKDLDGYFQKKLFQLSLDKSLSIVVDKKKFLIYSEDMLKIKDFNIGFLNTITNKVVPVNKILISKSEYPIKTFEYDFKSLISKYNNIQFDAKLNKYTFKSGKYIINDDIIFPYDSNVLIEKGSHIKIAENKSIVVYGDLMIDGTHDQKVTISNLTINKPFGVVGSIGNGGTTTTINHLELYGGKDAIINGSYLSGAISVYSNKSVVIKNSHIHHNSSDDGLNIKNSKIELTNNIFNANSADQVDIDFCIGSIKKNKFISKSIVRDFNFVKIPEDNNGDGLDLSGSEIIVRNNIFNGFLDKGISVGENTKVQILENNFISNRSAITAKDHSNVYLYGNHYEKNKINIEMYQKKQIFSHPSIFNVNENHLAKMIEKTKKSHYYKSKYKFNLYETSNSFKELEDRKWIEYE
jgi:hypothetical protein